MAKWGKGDPRWIVEERADATNVNNWHWTERDASRWSKDKLKELLSNIKVADENGQCEIHEVAEIEGEASASNRKAKLIFFYEWNIKLEWKGTLTDSTTELQGTVKIPNLSDENEVDEVDIEISVKKATPEANILREVMKRHGVTSIRQRLLEYIQALKKEFSQGMILPSKTQGPNESALNSSGTPKTALVVEKESAAHSGQETKQMENLSLGAKIQTSKLEMTQEFKCEAPQLYMVFTEVNTLQAFTQASASLQVEAGGKFVMLDGNITGEFVSLEPHSKIVMKWRFKSWPDGHHSLVTLQFKQKSDCTELTLTQKGVPTFDLDRTKHGWNGIFFDRIKGLFGFGASLF